jgi:hypothetical protein
MNSETPNQKPQFQHELEPEHRIAALEHERMTGADAPVEADAEGRKPLTDSQRAVIHSRHSGSDTAAMTARESDQLGREKQAISPRRGDTVRLQVIESGGVVSAKFGTVTGVSNLDENRQGENGEPYLSVAWCHSSDAELLGGPDWHKAFTRTGPIHHHTAPSAKAGQESVVWVDLIPADSVDDAITLQGLDLNQDQASRLANAEQQRAAQGGEGYGPIRTHAGHYLQADTTATGAVQAGRMTPKAPENTPQAVDQLIRKPLAPAPAGTSTEEEIEAHRARQRTALQQRGAEVPQDARFDRTGAVPMEGAATDPGSVGSETIGAAVQGETFEANAEHPTGRPFQAPGAAHEHQPE